MSESNAGRPTVMTPEVIAKLEEVFALGGSDLEACGYAGIGKDSLYRYQLENPEFCERKEKLKELPVLRARRTMNAVLEIPEHAKWYLERKVKKEFAQRQELTGDEGKPLGQILGELEKTDYERFTKEIKEQMVANDTPLQDKGQAGTTNPVHTECDANPTPVGEGNESPTTVS